MTENYWSDYYVLIYRHQEGEHASFPDEQFYVVRVKDPLERDGEVKACFQALEDAHEYIKRRYPAYTLVTDLDRELRLDERTAIFQAHGAYWEERLEALYRKPVLVRDQCG